MGILRYIKMTFKDDLKQSLFYMAVIIFSVAIIFNIFNISLNKEIFNFENTEYLSMSGLGAIIMVVSIMFIVFANSYYMENKFKEYAVISISGSSIKNICKLITIRNTIIALISVSLGCILGVLLSIPAMQLMGSFFNVKTGFLCISKFSLVTTIVLMFSEMEMVFITNTGKVYNSTINELFHRDIKAFIPDKRKHRVFPILYILLYLFPIICGIIPMSLADKILMIRYASLVGLLGVWGGVRYVIPGFIKRYREKELIIDKFKLIWLSNVYSSIQNSGMVVIVLVIAVLLSVMAGSGYKAGSLVSTMSLACYGMIIIIMSLTVIYKFVIEAGERRNNFKQLKLLGYTSTQIAKIIVNEVKTYYAMLILIALPYVFMIALSSVLDGLMGAGTEAIILIAYVLVFSLTGIVSYKLYKKSVL